MINIKTDNEDKEGFQLEVIIKGRGDYIRSYV